MRREAEVSERPWHPVGGSCWPLEAPLCGLERAPQQISSP